MSKKYINYFKINKDYFPVVDESVINSGKVDWKKFYPHETFVKLIDDTIQVLSRNKKSSIWVEGAYGTGKSHAVLTLKKLLDASEMETKEYFDTYPKLLTPDLYNKFQNVKSQDKKIITIHKYGSSEIKDDNDLILTIMEKIEKGLKEKKLDTCGGSLKESVIKWVSDKFNKEYFNNLITNKYVDLFNGDTADIVLKKLDMYDEIALIELMDKIFEVGKKEGINAFKIDIENLVNWIKAVIAKNQLKGLVFIWDEFTEYFQNNKRSLTGFQSLAELSATEPFYFIIVTHKSSALFNDTDKDKTKILDRFVRPTCKIELPKNMAFRLMGTAMEKNSDKKIFDEWAEYSEDLNSMLNDSRSLVIEDAKISEDELKSILPIHPYTALLLKYISSTFSSNQRSMFEFLKNDSGDDVKAFQWFIKNYGPENDSPFLTIDMLWDFFYEKGKEQLESGIRNILDSYSYTSKGLKEDEKQVLKTVLLFQAVSQHVGDSVDILLPNDKNINNAYDGCSVLDNGRAASIVNKFLTGNNKILYKKPGKDGKYQYGAMINARDRGAVDKYKEEYEKIDTSKLVEMSNFSEILNLTGALKLRYDVYISTVDNFKFNMKSIYKKNGVLGNKIIAVLTVSRNEDENISLDKLITDEVKNLDADNVIFINASNSTVGKKEFDQYVEYMANYKYQLSNDPVQAKQYMKNAEEIIEKWKQNIEKGEFYIYTKAITTGERKINIDEVIRALKDYNRKKYSYSLESEYWMLDYLFAGTAYGQGVDVALDHNLKGTFKNSNKTKQIECALKEAWDYENHKEYWKEAKLQNTLIYKLKNKVESIIKEDFEKDGRVSISKIYGVLEKAPYGFMPCNITGFVMGFLLKEYALPTFNWTDKLNNMSMSGEKLKEMIVEVIKNQQTPSSKFKPKYIVEISEAARLFNKNSAEAFSIPLEKCVSYERTRDLVRGEIKKLPFPLWSLKYSIDKLEMLTNKEEIENLIDNYVGIININNAVDKDASDSKLATNIVAICNNNINAVNDFKKLCTRENSIEGMNEYIKTFNGGELIKLTQQVGADANYMQRLIAKFDNVDAANWVWSIDSVKNGIEEVITEFKIIIESNNNLTHTSSYEMAINEWCNKCEYIKVSYSAAKNYLDDEKILLDKFLVIKKMGSLKDPKEQKEFLELLKTKINGFNNFYNNQIEYFKKISSNFINDMTDDEIENIFDQIPYGMFTKDSGEYKSTVKTLVDMFKKNQSKTKLKNLWNEKTDSISPLEWSNKFKTPILCMVPEDKVVEARSVFNTINKNISDENAVTSAIEFINSNIFWGDLINKEKRDNAFEIHIVKKYNIMLPNADTVRNFLSCNIGDDVYNWFGNPTVEAKIKKLAEDEYDIKGNLLAMNVIDKMDETKLKDYLKKMIKNNIIVGMEIIKNK